MITSDLFKALAIMGKGMLGIFVVIGIIAIIIYFLTKFTGKKEENAE